MIVATLMTCLLDTHFVISYLLLTASRYRGTEYLSPVVEGIHNCISCPAGFSLVVLGKTNMAFPHCDGVEDGNCKVGDLFHLNFGACVRTFNEVGDRAVEELRRDVKKWYADMYGGADINVGHTEEDRADFTVVDLEEEEEEEEVGDYKVKVSLERLETLWVATVRLLFVCQMINCSIVFLCGYALRNLLGWSRVYSGKTFKTASDALNFDHLRLFSALLMVVAATFQFAVLFDANTEASTGLGSLDKRAFINHMSVVTA